MALIRRMALKRSGLISAWMAGFAMDLYTRACVPKGWFKFNTFVFSFPGV